MNGIMQEFINLLVNEGYPVKYRENGPEEPASIGWIYLKLPYIQFDHLIIMNDWLNKHNYEIKVLNFLKQGEVALRVAERG